LVVVCESIHRLPCSHQRIMPSSTITLAVGMGLPLVQSFGIGMAATPAASALRCASSPTMIAEMIKPLTSPSSGKASLGSVLPDCPTTKWDVDGLDAAEWQKKYQEEDMPACPVEVVATAADNAMGLEYFVQRRDEFEAMLAKHGTIWFRGFDLMKDPVGFRTFWEDGLALPPCLDPIHSSGLRKFLSERDAVYEEVNKQSLSQHYIGLHQEMTEKRTAKAGAFVCFQPATISGGEFMIADGARIFRDMDPEALQTLIDRKVRISVSNLDLDFLDLLPGATKEDAMNAVKNKVAETVAPKFDMDLEMIWGNDGNEMRLQAIELAQSPVNRHPETGRPVWFCNMHNHARFLRERRCCSVPEVGMTDVFFGDLDLIPGELLQKVNEACEKNIVRVPMESGDVLLCDNYRVLHGRDVFVGERQHAVSWFGDDSSGPVGDKAVRNDGLRGFINEIIVGQ